MNVTIPPRLKRGDTIGICSPSGTIAHKRELFEQAKVNFAKATGLQILVAPNALKRHYYSAGTLKERLEDFHSLVTNPEVKAIIFSAGGDTAIDLVPHLDYDLIVKHPKIIAGISDATTLLSAITAKTGLVTFLGLEFLDFANHSMPYLVESITKAWFQDDMKVVHPNPNWKELAHTPNRYQGWQTIKAGAATGKFVGGNLQSFLQLVDTEYELPFKDSILFLETYRLPKKQIHKALMQLKLRGKFADVKGLLVGYCLECDNPEVVGNEQSLAETMSEIFQDYDFPIMQIGEIGHCVENVLQPLGVQVRIDATKLQFEVLEAVAT